MGEWLRVPTEAVPALPLHDSLNPWIGQGARQQALLRIFASLVYAEMDPNAAANDGPRTKSPTRMRRERRQASASERGRLTPVGNGGGIFRGGSPGYVPRQRTTPLRHSLHCANLLARQLLLSLASRTHMLELRGVTVKSEEVLIEAVAW